MVLQSPFFLKKQTEESKKLQPVNTHNKKKEKEEGKKKKKGNRSCHQWSTPDSLLGREKQEGTSIDEA